ncbi:MAG TPA: 16S rRNA (uracil(1498)-N(3))-methyltransferase [Myxococcaceae bacterium]|nr:16S rRNA (uracil(1498)-N(3))-methyltransferase [Myxococcaceae bacterium]
MNLLLLEPDEPSPDGTARLTGDRLRHLRDVLRAGPGSALRAGVLGGNVGTAEVLALGEAEAVLRCTFDRAPPPRPGLDLVLALPRPKALRRVLAASASMGVDRLVLLAAARVEKSYFASPVLQPDRIRKHLLDGLEQAQDTVLPEVHLEPRFRPFVEDRMDALLGPGERWLLHPGDEGPRTPSDEGRLALAVGPEGGWVPFERDLLQSRGFRSLGFGPRTLRTETIVPYALGWATGRRRAADRLYLGAGRR